MPTVLRIHGYRFYFWLHDLSVARMEGLKATEIRKVLLLAREHQSHLLASWHEFEGRKS